MKLWNDVNISLYSNIMKVCWIYSILFSVDEMDLKVEACLSEEGLYDIDISSTLHKTTKQIRQAQGPIYLYSLEGSVHGKRTGFDHLESDSMLHKLTRSNNLQLLCQDIGPQLCWTVKLQKRKFHHCIIMIAFIL